jgi:predicted Zn finger-like uncharacterized protein
MILVCPLCNTRYLIPASAFAGGARQVRCAKCSHSWQAEPPKELDLVQTHTLEPVTIERRPIPQGSNLPAVIKEPMPKWLSFAIISASFFAILALLGWLILVRGSIVKIWPAMETVYDHVGLHVFYVGEGLNLTNVRSELRYEDGIMKLYVEGNIVNTTEKIQKIPNLNASAIGSDGENMQSWQIDAPAATLEPKGTLPFTSSINGPKGTVVNVNLNFIEPKDAD